MAEAKRSKGGLITLTVVLICVLIVGVAGYNILANRTAAGNTAQAEAFEPAPEFSLLDADGHSTTFSKEADGRPAVINFWATWCPYCVDEMPDFQRLYDKYGDAVAFMMVDSVGSRDETADKGAAYVAEQGFTFPVYYDSERNAQNAYQVSSYPVTVLVNADGTIAAVSIGRVDYSLMDEALSKLTS